MGEFTMSQIASWRPETLIAGADEAKAHNTRLLGILDGIKDATNKMAAESTGPGETARFDFIDRTTKFGYTKHELMVQHQQLVEEAAYDLKAKTDRLLTEVQAARKAGLIVWDDGNVSGEVPRQREELEKYTASIGEAKHALEQADKEHARKIRELNEKIKEGTEGGYREADHFEKFGNLKDEPPPGSKEPVIHDNDPNWPSGKQTHIGLDLPPYQPGTLSNEETRTVYVRGEMEVDKLVQLERSQGLSEEQIARNAFERRNALRTWCRQLMSDRIAADNLSQTRPNLTWEQLLQKEAAKGNTGDAAYREIANSAVRSNPSVNEKTGVDPKNPPQLPPVRGASLSVPPPEPRPEEAPAGGRMRPELEGGGGGRMRPQIEGRGEWVPSGPFERPKGE